MGPTSEILAVILCVFVGVLSDARLERNYLALWITNVEDWFELLPSYWVDPNLLCADFALHRWFSTSRTFLNNVNN